MKTACLPDRSLGLKYGLRGQEARGLRAALGRKGRDWLFFLLVALVWTAPLTAHVAWVWLLMRIWH